MDFILVPTHHLSTILSLQLLCYLSTYLPTHGELGKKNIMQVDSLFTQIHLITFPTSGKIIPCRYDACGSICTGETWICFTQLGERLSIFTFIFLNNRLFCHAQMEVFSDNENTHTIFNNELLPVFLLSLPQSYPLLWYM